MTESIHACPFCIPPPERVLVAGNEAVALWDGHPLNPGHALVVPRRHVVSWFEATAAERNEIVSLADAVRLIVAERFSPVAFNLGINDGPAAGRRFRTSTCT